MERTGVKSLKRYRKFITGQVDISTVMRCGSLVNLGMGRWRAEQKLIPEDLCLKNSELMEGYIRLGKKTLINPKLQKKLNSIESSARAAVKRYSYDTPFGWFVPAAAFEVLDDLMLGYEKQWNEQRNELVREFEKHQGEIVNAYRSFAFKLYKTLRRKGSARGFAQDYVHRITAKTPTPKFVHDSFYFSFQSGPVPIPTVMSEQVKKELLAEAKTQAKLATALKREESIRKMNERQIARYEAKKEEHVDRFVDAVSNQIRATVLETCQTALASIGRNDGVCGRTYSSLKRLVSDFRMMNILEDAELETEIKRLETLVAGDARKDEKRVKEILTDLQNVALGTVIEITAPKRRMRNDVLGDGKEGDDWEAETVQPNRRAVRHDVI